jgi:hypothetical protein
MDESWFGNEGAYKKFFRHNRSLNGLLLFSMHQPSMKTNTP